MTYKLSKSSTNELINVLKSGDAYHIASSLFHISGLDLVGFDRESQPQPVTPTGNSEVIAHLEQLVEDRRWTIVDWHIPESYGEIRWLAARVLACEYAYRGIKTSIVLEDVVQPIKRRELTKIREELEVSHMNVVIEQRLMPKKTEIIRPQDYCEWCSKEAIEKRQHEQESEE